MNPRKKNGFILFKEKKSKLKIKSIHRNISIFDFFIYFKWQDRSLRIGYVIELTLLMKIGIMSFSYKRGDHFPYSFFFLSIHCILYKTNIYFIFFSIFLNDYFSY
jgi:hypothetical protein